MSDDELELPCACNAGVCGHVMRLRQDDEGLFIRYSGQFFAILDVETERKLLDWLKARQEKREEAFDD